MISKGFGNIDSPPLVCSLSFSVSLLSFVESPFVIDMNFCLFSDYIKWEIFVDNYDIKNYIKK